MNFADSEVVASIMSEVGVETTNNEMDADIIFINTCSIRDNAEQKIRHRLKHLRHNKKHNKHLTIGILGCMAERLKEATIRGRKTSRYCCGSGCLPRVTNTFTRSRKWS
jgi:tRNA-2-methylthio-N6-dimethylallyladenosine synthase